MNFLGHALLARRRSADPEWLLGAMLPDLVSMAGLRIESVEEGRLAEGVEFHHRTDDAFHGAPTVVDLMGDARDLLEERGLGLGPAMAVGHVGVELLLDGLLVSEPGLVDGYREALAHASNALSKVHFRRPEHESRFLHMHARLVASPLPEAYVEPDFVADRLIAILARRPRLAIEAEHVPLVFGWAHEARPGIAARVEVVLAEVETRLRGGP